MEHRERTFEREAQRRGLCLKRREDGSYHIATTREAWRFWCAAFEAGRVEGRREMERTAA